MIATLSITDAAGTVHPFPRIAAWADNTPRRIAVPFDGSVLGLARERPTGAFTYTLEAIVPHLSWSGDSRRDRT